MLELSEENFKTFMITMTQRAIMNTLETNKK